MWMIGLATDTEIKEMTDVGYELTKVDPAALNTLLDPTCGPLIY